MTPPRREAITGLVLCGGRGTRMGGIEKALLPWGPSTLVANALARLAPQVAAVAINANHHLERYASLAVPVWLDETPDRPGPLAGWLAALHHIPTEWLLSVPCDTPYFPPDLAARLAGALAHEGAPPLAIATTADGAQPVFALLHRSLAEPLAAALARGERGVGRFALAQGAAQVMFDNATAFADADTPDDLARLQPIPADLPR
jgi:molybdenum cofactor guanylyltransferase